MGIKEIILEELLFEGRLETVKNKYAQYDGDEVIDHLSSNDPSGNNKYLSWMAKMFFEFNVGLNSITDAINYFHNNVHKFDQKDINQFRNFRDFEIARENASLKKSKKELKEEGAEKIFENERYLVIRPKTHAASCQYGSNTRWCITMRDYANYFNSYTNQSSFFFVIDKVRQEPEPGFARRRYYKIAIQWQPRSNYAYLNHKDSFIESASKRNSYIFYWNSSDLNVTEKTFRKYVGNDAEPILNTIETYMKNLHTKFYEQEFENQKTNPRVKELEKEINDLTNVYNILYRRNQSIFNARRRIMSRLRAFNKSAKYYSDMLTRVRRSFLRLGKEVPDNETILKSLGLLDAFNEATRPSEDLTSKFDRITEVWELTKRRVHTVNRELSALRSELESLTGGRNNRKNIKYRE